MKLGEKIKKYRNHLNISQEGLAAMMKVTKQTIYLWEECLTTPSLDNLIKLSKFFNVSLDELCNDTSVSNTQATPIEETDIPEQRPTLESTTIQELNEYQSHPFANVETKYTTKMHHFILNYFDKNNKVCYWLGIIGCILAISALISFNNIITYCLSAIPLVLLGIVIGFYIRYERFVAKRTKDYFEVNSNANCKFTLYPTHFEMELLCDQGNQLFQKKYKEIDNKILYKDMLYLFFDNTIGVINLNSLDAQSRFRLLYMLHLIDNKQKERQTPLINDKIKGSMLTLFIMSIISLGIGFLAVYIAFSKTAIPEFFEASYEQFWRLIFVLPIPIVSLIFGILLKVKGYKCNKNIISGSIMAGLILIFGMTGVVESQKINHSYDFLNEVIAIKLNSYISFPEKGKISYVEFNNSEIEFYAMARFDQSEVNDFIQYVHSSEYWLNSDYYLHALNVIDVFKDDFEYIDFDYCCIYDVNCQKFNKVLVDEQHREHEIIFLAYSSNSNLLVSIGFTFYTPQYLYN